MITIDERKHTRIDLNLLANITLSNNETRLFSVKNISLSGMFVVTHSKAFIGMECHIELNSNLSGEGTRLEFSGRVVRQDLDGFGIEFTRMNSETYMMLQTGLLYHCQDPLTLGEEFAGKCPVAIREASNISHGYHA